MTDLTQLSNEQLQALYKQQSNAPPSPAAMSDEELKAAYSGQPQKKFTIYDTWPAQLAKSIYSGLTLPGDVYAGRESPDNTGRVLDLAGIISPGVPRPMPKAIPTTREIENAASKGFTGTRAAEADIDPRAISQLSDIFTGALQQKGFSPENSPETFSILGKLLNPPEGSVTTIPDLHSVRQSLGLAAQNFQNPREQKAASQVIGWLDRYLSNIPENNVLAGDPRAVADTLRDAIKNYAASAKSDQVTGALEAADLKASAANSGLNQGNATRQRMASILLDDKKSSGFTPDELAQMEQVVRGTTLGNLSRYMGNLLGGGGGLGQVVAGSAGGALGAMSSGPAGAGVGAALGAVAAPVAGNLFRMGANASTQRQARILDEMIRSRAPYSQEVMAGNNPLLPDQQRAQAIARILMLSQPQQATAGGI